MKKLMAMGVCVVALVATSCSGATSSAGSRMGVGTRTLSVTVSGAVNYSRTATVTGGAIGFRYTGSNTVEQIAGTVNVPGLSSGSASFTVGLDAFGSSFNGVVTMVDASAGIDVTVDHLAVAVSTDGDGDAMAAASSNGVTIEWSLTTVDAPGLEPTLDLLNADEADFCRYAQQSLAGLDPSQVPLSSITNNDYPSRPSFGGSKAVLSPLTTQSWREPREFDTANGHHVVFTDSISCKTRSADHLATTGVTTGADLACSTLNVAAASRAWSVLSAGEQLAYAGSGKSLAFAPDVANASGIEWLTPIVDQSLSGSVMTVTAHSLQVNWNDPDYAIFPDTIRGVHYCTTKSPAWFYWWYTKGAV